MNYEIGNPELAWLMLLVPIAIALFGYSAWTGRTARRKFGSKIKTGDAARDVFSVLLLTLGIGLLVLACMDIRWGKTTREVPQKGIEVVFALDVSRSMLAQDARPNRLARAKQQITDMVGEMAGDRVGLVVFAGEAIQAVPLTSHYNDFRQKLDAVGPHSVSTGGSQLGVAIQAASDAFISKTSDHKTIVLFTDGEDQESRPVELVKKLHAENAVRIFTVGLGDIDTGARIPQDRSNAQPFVEHQGQQVWSKLNGSILKQIAMQTQAAYIPAGTKRVNMADVYHNFIANIEQSEFETAKINGYIPRFQWFAFPAFLCLLVHAWFATGSNARVSARKRPAVSRESATSTAIPLASAKSKVAAVLLVLLPGVVSAQSATSPADKSVAAQINTANELVRNEKQHEAIEAYNAIDAAESGHRDALNYNLAGAHYRNSDFDAAMSLFSETAKSANDRIATDSRYNLGNCHFAKALPLTQQQPEAAIKELEQALKQYRSALRLDRQYADARENLERASKLIQQLSQDQHRDPQPKDPKQDQNQNQKQDQKQDQAENADQQKNQSESDEAEQSEEDRNESENQDQSQQSKQQSDQQKSDQQQNDQQQSESQDSKSQSGDEQNTDGDQSQGEPSQSQQNDSQASQSPQPPADPQTNSSDEDVENFRPESTDQQQSNPNQQRPDMPNSEGQENESPDELEKEKNESDDPPQGTVTAANESTTGEPREPEDISIANPLDQNQNKGMMSRQEALKLLQAVRDRDMLRRLRQQQRQRQRRVKVEKDW